jgi:hypothetical protein
LVKQIQRFRGFGRVAVDRPVGTALLSERSSASAKVKRFRRREEPSLTAERKAPTLSASGEA